MGLIHILEARRTSDSVRVRAAFHVPIGEAAFQAAVAARQMTSAVPDLPADESAQLQAGEVLELVKTLHFEPDRSKAQIRKELEAAYGRISEQATRRLAPEIAEQMSWAGATWDGQDWSQ